MKTIISVYFLSLLNFWCLAQRNAAINYTTKDGLPVNETNAVFVDGRGMVWVGSSMGATRFDGKQFQNFSMANGLGLAAVWDFQEEKNGRFWVKQYGYKPAEMEVSFREKDESKFNKIAIGEALNALVLELHTEPTRDQVLIIDGLKKWRLIPKTGEIIPLMEIFEVNSLPKAQLLAFNKLGESLIYYKKNTHQFGLKLRENNGVLRNIDTKNLLGEANLSSVFLFGNSKICLFNDTGFFYFNGVKWAQKQLETPPEVLRFQHQFDKTKFSDHTNFLVGLDKFKYQIYQIDLNGLLKSVCIFKTPYEIRQFASDKAGNFWVATTGGLLKVFPSIWEILSDDLNFISDIHTLAEDKFGVMWFGSNTGGMSSFDGQKIRAASGIISSKITFQPCHVTDSAGVMHFINGDNIVSFDGKLRPKLESASNKRGSGFFIGRAKDGEFAFGGSEEIGLGLRARDAVGWDSTVFKFYGKKIGLNLGNVLTAVKDPFGRWWMGRPIAGIAVLTEKRDTIYTFLRKDPKNDVGAMASTLDPWGNIWWGTSRGLAVWKPQKELDYANFRPAKDFRFLGEVEIGQHQIFQMTCTPDSQLVIGTARGFALIDLKFFYKSAETVLPIHFFDETNGYQVGSTEQNAVEIDRKGRIWIGADGGAVRFDPRLFQWNRTQPEVVIDSVEAGQVHRPTCQGRAYFCPELSATNSNLRIWFSTDFDSLQQSQTYFRYKFKSDSVWSDSKLDGVLEFRNLAAGIYQVEIQAFRGGIASEIRTLDFVIPVFWYLRWWFFVVVLTTLGGIIWFFKQKQLEIARTKQEINRLQVQTIVNQLNPHFINNALQWVQTRVFKEKDATRVLAYLGENIRIVFQNTRIGKSYHALGAEMNLVENYMLIQKARFGDRLEFELPDLGVISDNAAVLVPLMLFQIHCENAVEHGVANVEIGGKVTVKIAEMPDKLIILIEDNGVGRVVAAQIGSKGTQQGIEMLRELLAIFNQKNEPQISFQYEDLPFLNAENEPCGTRVIIHLPKFYQYEFN